MSGNGFANFSSDAGRSYPFGASSKLNMFRNADAVDIEDDDDEDASSETLPMLAKDDEPTSIYTDSPRSIAEDTLTDAEIRRRGRVGWSAISGIFMAIVTCCLLLHFLSHHESFSELPPTQQRFMAATTTSGVRENLEQYVAGTRHTGGAGSYEMAKFIKSQAIAFGIDEQYVQIEQFQLLVNEPETLKLTIHNATEPIKFDWMSNLTSWKKSSRMPFPPYHFYAKNGSVKGRLVYAHYGRNADYAALNASGVHVQDAIVLVRIGNISLPAKVMIASKHGAVGIITYNDPMEDGAGRGKPYPDGPWRTSEDASFGSVYMGNGDPSAPEGFCSASSSERISVDELYSSNNTDGVMPRIVSMPVSAHVASSLLGAVDNAEYPVASAIFSDWSGGALNASYRVGPSTVDVTVENKNKYVLKSAYNVVITIRGSREADRYVIVTAHRDSLSAGAVSPGSGNAVFLEILRALGTLMLGGWVPQRTLLLASFDGEQFGSIGSANWIDQHFARLGEGGVIYLRLRDVVRGAGPLRAEAAASVRKNLILVTTKVAQPKSAFNTSKFFNAASISAKSGSPSPSSSPRQLGEIRAITNGDVHPAVTHNPESTEANDDSSDVPLLPLNSTFGVQDLPDSGDSVYSYWLQAERKINPQAMLPSIRSPGSNYRVSPFLGRLGIPSIELSFDGGYFGVENSRNDSLDWVKKFGDPTFAYHRAATQLYGSIMLAFSNSVFLPYDFTEVARDLRRGEASLQVLSEQYQLSLPLKFLSDAISRFEAAAINVAKEIEHMSDEMINLFSGEMVIDLKRVRDMNTRLLMAQKAFVFPAGLPELPWLKHVVYGNSKHDDYRIVFFPAIVYEIHEGNAVRIKYELIRLRMAIEQAAEILSSSLL